MECKIVADKNGLLYRVIETPLTTTYILMPGQRIKDAVEEVRVENILNTFELRREKQRSKQ